MNFNSDEINYMIKAIDAMIRRDGIAVAGLGVAIAMKLQQSALPVVDAADVELVKDDEKSAETQPA